MRIHYMLNHQWGNFKCDLCDYFAYYSTDFAYHVLTMHAGGGGGGDDTDPKKITATCPECELAVPESNQINFQSPAKRLFLGCVIRGRIGDEFTQPRNRFLMFS